MSETTKQNALMSKGTTVRSMGNVRNVVGNKHATRETERFFSSSTDSTNTANIATAYVWRHGEWRIKDMKPGEVGYTVPWAYELGHLSSEYEIYRFRFFRGDTLRLIVRCIKSGLYDIEYKDGTEPALTWEAMTNKQRLAFGLKENKRETNG